MIEPTIVAGASVSQAICLLWWLNCCLTGPSFTIDQPGFCYCWGKMWLRVSVWAFIVHEHECLHIYSCLFGSLFTRRLCLILYLLHKDYKKTMCHKMQDLKKLSFPWENTFQKTQYYISSLQCCCALCFRATIIFACVSILCVSVAWSVLVCSNMTSTHNPSTASLAQYRWMSLVTAFSHGQSLAIAAYGAS